MTHEEIKKAQVLLADTLEIIFFKSKFLTRPSKFNHLELKELGVDNPTLFQN